MLLLNENMFEMDVPDVSNVEIDIEDMETPIPVAGPELGASSLIMQAIQDCYSLIENYNSLSIALSDIQEIDMAQDVADIISTEHINISVLQSLLNKLSPTSVVEE